MKIAVFGPDKRVGALRGEEIVDLSLAYAKLLKEREGETPPARQYQRHGVLYWEYIEYLSRDLTLYPGDIISGETAAGTAAYSSPRMADGQFAPERFLKTGDVVEIKSPTIRTLQARIIAK